MPEARRPTDPDPKLATSVQPLDEHNQRLVDNVCPVDWVNPDPADRYHLVVIGGGTAGLVSAAGAAALGARVALIERRLLGGDCLNHGCVPSKAVIRAGRAWSEARGAAERFGGPQISSPGDFGVAMERMRRLRARLSGHDSARRFRELGVDVFLGDGRFVADDVIQVDGRHLRFRRAIIASGARPASMSACQEGTFLTSETVFSLTELPRQFGVIGGGPIGCELAQTFARLGSRVTLFELSPQLLPRDDADAAAIVQQAMARDGVHLELGAKVLRVVPTPGGKDVHFQRDGRRSHVRVDELLVAVGRTPNVEGLGLEVAGIRFNRDGIEVNARLRTSNRRVYAAGDVASRYRFTHTADALARIAIQNALFFGRAKASDLVVPWCTYTSPEVAHVGISARDAERRGQQIDTLTIPLAEVDRAVLDDADEGFLRLHLRKGTDRILGATLVAEHAGELLGEISLAVTARVGLAKIANTIHPYPTQAEVVKKAADAWRRGKLTPAVKMVLSAFFRLFP